MFKDGRGWHREPVRHALAAKGIKTGQRTGQDRLKWAKRQRWMKANRSLLDDAMRSLERTIEAYLIQSPDALATDIMEARDIYGMRRDRTMQAQRYVVGQHGGPDAIMELDGLQAVRAVQLWNAAPESRRRWMMGPVLGVISEREYADELAKGYFHSLPLGLRDSLIKNVYLLE